MRTLADVYIVCLVQLLISFLGDGVHEVVQLSLHDDGLLGGARWVRIYIVLFQGMRLNFVRDFVFTR